MKQYSADELDQKIRNFVDKKFDKYPELKEEHVKMPLFEKFDPMRLKTVFHPLSPRVS